MKIVIPDLSLVLLIGTSGCGKSTFAQKHFKPTEVLSSDYCRGLVSDDENDQAASRDAFEVLHFIAAKRLRAGKLTVIDATNVQAEARKPLIAIAREFHVLPVGIVLNPPVRVCIDRNRARPDRDFGPHVIQRQAQDLRRSFKQLEREGLRRVFELSSVEEIEAATVEREPLWNNRKQEHGPFDIIGDVHGCGDELEELMVKLSSSGIWWIAGRASQRSWRSSWEWCRQAPRSASPGIMTSSCCANCAAIRCRLLTAWRIRWSN
jgi:protein phosphatase